MDVFHGLYFSFLFVSTIIAMVLASDPYSEALLSLKSEVVDDYNSLDDWLVPPGSGNPLGKVIACSWSGVKCNNNSTIVIALDLSMKNLGGALSGKQFGVFTELVDLNISYNSFFSQLPVEIFNLTNLASLDISRNNFSGQLPSGISGLRNLVVLDAFSNSFEGLLPIEISQLQHLKILNLAGSYFNGPIPPQYGSFKSLEFLHLAGNFLGGSIPPELGQLKTVTHMEIGYNSYQGSIPWQLGNMSEIQYLDIAGANLSGSIPMQLSNLTKLQSLFLFRNHLTGQIPREFSRIRNLISLDLSDNQISGAIPESFAELKNLRLLSLMYNEMNGTVPEAIAALPSLDTLFIWNNFFSGSLPLHLGRNSKLRWVDVSTNNLIGTIPPDICAGGVLFKLILFSNSFTGSLSPSLSNCSSLVRLRLEDNSFSGDILLNFSNLPHIAYIDLSRNKFTGGIPVDVSKASKLEYFNVSNNPELGGIIPAQTWSLPLLQNFSASACNISGNIPPFNSCKSISAIEVHTNNLSGNAPDSVSNCHALERLDLSNNKFTGNIPEELASLPDLEFLDLSHNNLCGQIPSKLGSSSSLLVLNVSFNDISGTIPANKVLRSMGGSAYVGNPKLCGPPLGPCASSMVILGSKGTGKLILVLLLCAGIVMFIVASVLGIFYIRRGSGGQWKMISFIGLPRFTTDDVLRSFNPTHSKEAMPQLPGSLCKAVLPTGITVSVKKVEWEAKRMEAVSEFIRRMGNARHKNLIRLLGFCYNKRMGYLLYDHFPNGNLSENLIRMKRDCAAKYQIVIGIAKGLCFLHHDCYPAIPHGDLKSSNVLLDDNMEPHLTEFAFKYLVWLANCSSPATIHGRETGEFNSTIKEELYNDIYSFGEMIVEILTNGRLKNAGGSIQSKPREILWREICSDNEVGSTNSLQEEIKVVLDVALLCTRSRPSQRLSMQEALKLLSAMKPTKKIR
ncbi:LRR_1 domain-containing protein/Pkinase_Tyr domain-containing protein/LRRNT_2 domain-containing protein/LRR_4 domain-containing protein/LRR_8 domain-containing protein [Cephalotus follicularis]|uniref:LRR_1 domain-containing protein/Pkinase_Tyr domain-containing protein/LRRNT_2 domain-containing protein/LRR_4 domain-containing protein/LRR_8 domain-containing protein n=1 Tax=Cephalotus follicularis TaxID=3775 RepID=A0A1Q3CV72_CEPFO|nr:LRR_1 domain-containing protein/Pkinase_Tyr domain-containing protein/LRRNT_2 domain-containing protein/LRR_4 domain-containing protein/LRR_8 domain-containing protein [Cephalotus follicularis]